MERNQIDLEKQQKKRTKRERGAIVVLAILLVVLTIVEIRFTHFGDKLSLLNSFIFYGFKNVSIIFALILLFLLCRNIIKTYMESRSIGSSIRTKLVMAFLGFAVIPTVLLFFISAFFIQSSFERWFSLRIERSFKESMDVANYTYKLREEQVLQVAAKLSNFIEEEKLNRNNKSEYLKKVLKEFAKEHDIDAVEIQYANRAPVVHGTDTYYKIIGPFEDYAHDGFSGLSYSKIEHLGEGDMVRGVMPVSYGKNVDAVVVASKFIPLRLAKKLMELRRYYSDYTAIKPMEKPLKANYFVILVLMTLMILFGATWFGIYLSKQLTTPITKLVDATEQITSGNLDVYVAMEGKDEIGRLVQAFNKMTTDIKVGKGRLDKAAGKLKLSIQELREKQEYIEIVLRNVSTGVISLNRKGEITTINDYAQKLLEIETGSVLGTHYKDLIKNTEIEEDFLSAVVEMSRKELNVIEKVVIGKFKEKHVHLKVNISLLKSRDKKYLGVVIVFEDLSELQKTQRIAAWREVARRIAHEIKNPLTPIQLSAQRLYRRYLPKFENQPEEAEVFTNCTNMIIEQVGSIKRMVNEFADFARMPAAHPKPMSLDVIIKDVLELYKQVMAKVNVEYHNFSTVDTLLLDNDQIKRVFINLIDNALAALDETIEPEIRIVVSNNAILEIVSIEFIDNGPGILPEVMDRLFEPYFSTKGTSGTGLGLSIIKQIITDHSGYIRVSSSKATGTRFLIELPSYKTEKVFEPIARETAPKFIENKRGENYV